MVWLVYDSFMSNKDANQKQEQGTRIFKGSTAMLAMATALVTLI